MLKRGDIVEFRGFIGIVLCVSDTSVDINWISRRGSHTEDGTLIYFRPPYDCHDCSFFYPNKFVDKNTAARWPAPELQVVTHAD